MIKEIDVDIVIGLDKDIYSLICYNNIATWCPIKWYYYNN